MTCWFHGGRGLASALCSHSHSHVFMTSDDAIPIRARLRDMVPCMLLSGQFLLDNQATLKTVFDNYHKLNLNANVLFQRKTIIIFIDPMLRLTSGRHRPDGFPSLRTYPEQDYSDLYRIDTDSTYRYRINIYSISIRVVLIWVAFGIVSKLCQYLNFMVYLVYSQEP